MESRCLRMAGFWLWSPFHECQIQYLFHKSVRCNGVCLRQQRRGLLGDSPNAFDLEARALPLRTLLEIAEVFRPSGDQMIVGYRSGYTDRALPLGENEARRFRHAMALLGAFEGLYRRAFEKALGAPPRDPRRKDLAVALERSMACVVGQMIEHYRARQTVGLALWKRLQQDMQAARREKLDAVEVADPLHLRGTAAPLATYGRALLLSIAQAGAMTHRSLEATLALTALFAHLVESAMLDSKEGGRAVAQEGMAGWESSAPDASASSR
jgi:hypothetical protein